uniref:Uncharacterized protein n=1 Tax=Compsopogon caeruleus TaxID=31354 RepID=A0A7S1XEK8_9RHOD
MSEEGVGRKDFEQVAERFLASLAGDPIQNAFLNLKGSRLDTGVTTAQARRALKGLVQDRTGRVVNEDEIKSCFLKFKLKDATVDWECFRQVALELIDQNPTENMNDPLWAF